VGGRASGNPLDHHDEQNPVFIPAAQPADAPAIHVIAQLNRLENPQEFRFHLHSQWTCMALAEARSQHSGRLGIILQNHQTGLSLSPWLTKRVSVRTCLGIAAIGIYGVMAYTFSRRIGEFGLRMALGAQRSDILKVALGEGARMVVFGVAAGLIGSAASTRFLQTLLFEIKPTDPITFGVLTALLASVALLACLIPARRATRVDPLMALRHE
jgi:predicted lysophospholipase L1 biosynthesis ABC-type transport system permease subunit